MLQARHLMPRLGVRVRLTQLSQHSDTEALEFFGVRLDRAAEHIAGW